jgi:cytochrome P450
MRSIFYHVLKDKNIYDRLQAEIDEAEEQGRLSNPVTFNEAMQLPYLVAVCKEGMRVFPSVGMTLPRHVPAGGRVICGKYFPEGVSLAMGSSISVNKIMSD